MAITVGSSTITVNSGAVMPAPPGTNDLFFARAWVVFNGTGTIAITASGGVTSISDGGSGTYSVNFPAMYNEHYSCAFTCAFAIDGNDYATGASTAATTSCDVFIVNSANGTRNDSNRVCATFFR